MKRWACGVGEGEQKDAGRVKRTQTLLTGKSGGKIIRGMKVK